MHPFDANLFTNKKKIQINEINKLESRKYENRENQKTNKKEYENQTKGKNFFKFRILQQIARRKNHLIYSVESFHRFIEHEFIGV